MSVTPVRAIMFAAITVLPAAAQRADAQLMASANASRNAVLATPKEVVRLASAVRVTSTPPSFETIEILRPIELPDDRPLQYTVIPTGSMRVLGALDGVLSPRGGAPGSVLITFSVPRRARAGIVEVARVRFVAEGVAPVEVPVQVEVAQASGISLVVSPNEYRAVQGGWIAVVYSVANLGNRPENVAITAIVPAGWRVSSARDATLTLDVNEVVERRLEVEIPETGSTGSAIVRLVASIGGSPVATAEANVSVLARGTRREIGSTLTTGLTLARGPTGSVPVASAELSGHLSPGVRISGQYTSEPSSAAAGNLALYRLGTYPRPASLQLQSESWQLNLGHTGFQFGELTGYGVWGNGVSTTARNNRWTASGLLATPGWRSGIDAREGRLAGGRINVDAGLVTLSATGTHLTETGFDDRELDAWSFGAASESFLDGTVSGEVAHRTYATGAGLGYAMRFDRQTPGRAMHLRVINAPGGRAAFAQAADQVSVNVSQSLSRAISLHGAYWDSRDGATASFSALRSGGWSGGINVRLTSGVNFALDARENRFDAAGSAGVLATDDRGLEATVDLKRGSAYVRARGTVGSTRRITAMAGDVVPLREEGGRHGVDGTIGVQVAGGTFMLDGRYDRADPASGSVPERAEVAVRAERIPVLRRGAVVLTAKGEVRHSVWPGFGPARRTLVAGLEARLPAGFVVEFAAEQNPWFVTAANGTPWVYGVKIQRASLLPAIRRVETRGVVYRDLDGNGRRDPREPGLAGVVIRHRDQSVLTGTDGGFRLPGDAASGLLDPLSLDAGWVTGRVAMVDGQQEIAVIPVAPVHVVLRILDRQGVGLSADTLRAAAVLAKHESGRIWVARRATSDTAVFDALLPGRYTLEVDLTEVKAAVAVIDALPTFEVRAGARIEPIILTLSPREFRIRKFDPPPTDRDEESGP